MPRAPLLSDAEIETSVARLRGWHREGSRLVKRFAFTDFAEAVGFVSSLVPQADAQDHHPDVAIHWNEVTLTLWTHASGGLTERDVRLAATIDDMTEDR